MHPVCFEGTVFEISAYLLFGFIAAVYLLVASSLILTKHAVSFKRIMIMDALLVVSFLVGSRLLYGVLYFDKILQDPMKLFVLRWVNFSLYGGLTLSFFVWWQMAKFYQLSFWSLTDRLIIHAGIAAALLKMGCFFNGCCYGIATNVAWAIELPVKSVDVFSKLMGSNPLIQLVSQTETVMRHPTQLYEVFFALLAAFVACIVIKRGRVSGLATGTFMIVYSCGRWLSFAFRSFPQASSLSNFIRGPVVYSLVIIGGVLMIWYRLRTSKNHGQSL